MSPARNEPWKPWELSRGWRGRAWRPNLRLLPCLTEMVPLSQLEEGGQPPAPESPEVSHRALALLPVLFFSG